MIRAMCLAKGLDLHLEVARTAAEQERGLMFRRSVPANTGMLFVFPDVQVRSFTMHNTLVSLDMVFLDSAGVIVDIIDCAEPLSKGPYVSLVPARFVIELKCNSAATLDVGDQFLFQ